MNTNTQSDLTQILEIEWTRKDVQRIWSEASADRYDAIKDAHNSETAALVKALRRQAEIIRYLCGTQSGLAFFCQREITAILNQGRKD